MRSAFSFGSFVKREIDAGFKNPRLLTAVWNLITKSFDVSSVRRYSFNHAHGQEKKEIELTDWFSEVEIPISSMYSSAADADAA